MGGASRPDALRRLDGRTRAAKYVAGIERALIADLGGRGRITTAQQLLCERVALDMLRLRLLDHELIHGGGRFSLHDGRVASALRNSVRLGLRTLGLEAAKVAAPPQMTAVEYGEMLDQQRKAGAKAKDKPPPRVWTEARKRGATR